MPQRAPDWSLRYAPHLGYRAADAPLFKHTARSVAPCDQAAHVRALSFAGVQYPWAVARPPRERRALADALRELRLACGCTVWAPFDALSAPHWVQTHQRARAALRAHLEEAIQVAAELGSEIIAVLGAGDDSPLERQRSAMAENLRWAGDLAAAHGLTIGLEPMIALPNMALKSCDDGLAMIRRANHPAVQLIFDTGHVHDVEPDVAAALDRAFEDVCLVQFADQPGRVEPGAGTIAFENILQLLHRRAYGGLVELEHAWKSDTTEGELEGVARLRALDRTTC